MKNSRNKPEAIQNSAVLGTVAQGHMAPSLQRAFATSLMILLAAPNGRADEIRADTRLQPVQELFRTDLVYPQEAGEVQVTLAPTFRRERGADVFDSPLSVEYGLTDAWQVELEWTALIHRNPNHARPARGIGDLECGTQYSLMNVNGSAFHVASRFSVHLPLGTINNELTEGFVEYEPSLILATDAPELHNAQFFGQVGLSLVQRVKDPADADDREPAAHELVWSAGTFVPFARWVASMEFSGNNNQWNHGGKSNEMYLTPGGVWKLTRAMEVGAGVSLGLNRGSDRLRFTTQLIREF